MAEEYERRAVLAKSLSLIEKTRSRIAQIDDRKFPTRASVAAKNLINAALTALANREQLKIVSPEVLYCQLLRIQCLVEEIESSVVDRISWPIVNYCDDIRSIFFKESSDEMFYSLTREHNYSIADFSARLQRALKDLLPKAELDRLFGGPKILCLSLSSLEDDNLPLYANIGHEFGHALFETKQIELANMFVPLFQGIAEKAQKEFSSDNQQTTVALMSTLFAYGTELYCDLVGALLMGPAFLLSLYEMSWGVVGDKMSWTEDGYPSWYFRFACIKEWVSLDSFVAQSRQEFATKLDSPQLKQMPALLLNIPSNHSRDEIYKECGSGRANACKEFMERNLPEIKNAFIEFLNQCRARLQEDCKGIRSVSPAHIAELLHRLESGILPNIIPSKNPRMDILGTPAPFQEILNASAIFRSEILIRADGASSPEIREELQKIERLTSKALEVSYIQKRYKGLTAGHGNPKSAAN